MYIFLSHATDVTLYHRHVTCVSHPYKKPSKNKWKQSMQMVGINADRRMFPSKSKDEQLSYFLWSVSYRTTRYVLSTCCITLNTQLKHNIIQHVVCRSMRRDHPFNVLMNKHFTKSIHIWPWVLQKTNNNLPILYFGVNMLYQKLNDIYQSCLNICSKIFRTVLLISLYFVHLYKISITLMVARHSLYYDVIPYWRQSVRHLVEYTYRNIFTWKCIYSSNLLNSLQTIIAT